MDKQHVIPADISNPDTEEGIQINPIVHPLKEGKPSNAFLQSMKNARNATNGEWRDTRITSSQREKSMRQIVQKPNS